MRGSVKFIHELNMRVYEAACDRLDLTLRPDIHINHAPQGGKHYGTYIPVYNRIDIYVGLPEHASERLSAVTRQITHTILHELRHAWQHRNWTSEFFGRDDNKQYAEQARERDANDWADRYLSDFPGLVRVRRITRNNGFSRLSMHSRQRV